MFASEWVAWRWLGGHKFLYFAGNMEKASTWSVSVHGRLQWMKKPYLCKREHALLQIVCDRKTRWHIIRWWYIGIESLLSGTRLRVKFDIINSVFSDALHYHIYSARRPKAANQSSPITYSNIHELITFKNHLTPRKTTTATGYHYQIKSQSPQNHIINHYPLSLPNIPSIIISSRFSSSSHSCPSASFSLE